MPRRSAPALDLEALLGALQGELARVLLWPQWLALLLLGFALLLIALHRHALRPLSGAVLGAGLVALALLVLAPWAGPGSALPGLCAVVGAGAAMGFGIVLPGWATACASAALFGLGGAAAARHIAEVHPAYGAAPFALLGFMLGLTNQLRLSLLLPPIAAAFLLTLASARLLAAHASGAHLPQLGEATWAGALFALLAICLIALSYEREHRRQKRLATRAGLLSNEELELKIARDKAAYAKHLGA